VSNPGNQPLPRSNGAEACYWLEDWKATRAGRLSGLDGKLSEEEARDSLLKV